MLHSAIYVLQTDKEYFVGALELAHEKRFSFWVLRLTAESKGTYWSRLEKQLN